MKFRIVTESCCDLPYSVLENEHVHVIPMVVTVDGKEYIDDSGKTFNSQWLMEEVQAGKPASTSQVNVGSYLEMFKSLIKEDSTPVIYLGFSSGLSGSFNNAMTAVNMLEDEYINVPITLVDTKQASLGEGLLVDKLVSLRNEGKTVEEAVAVIKQLSKRVQSWVTVDDLKHLERGGRVSKTAAAVGTLINIKPILIVTEEGKLESNSKTRGRKKAITKIADETRTNISVADTDKIFIAYAGDLEAAEVVKEKLSDLNVPIEMYPMGPTIACHTGFGGLAVFSIRK
ncbi:DegV family protein [Vagococcus zengguangii]|uniref:DegV family protein n=1 Tax=Vagococcus zengguangii TaxID=2571750 RepID=A0A4D7CMX2_9ENTE|nr:DegV family protein [Vagococcus zengguangii]QCI85455.1 DegV family protein [Vagococcus zengguangii]TLG80000.1 DegV family protein [Vagococcus zengguangii]